MTNAKQKHSALFGKEQRLSRRFFVIILLISFVTLCVSTVLQFWHEYRDGVKRIEANVRFIEESYLPAVTASLYTVDELQVRLLLRSMLKLEGVVFCRVLEMSEGKSLEFFEGDAALGKEPGHDFPLVYTTFDGLSIPVGSLTVKTDVSAVYRQLWARIPINFVTNIVIILLGAMVVMLLFQKLVARHLYRMAEFARAMAPEHLDRRLHLDRAPVNDELDQVVSAVNALQKRLHEDIDKRKETERLLRESEQRYRSLNDNMPVGVFRTTPDGKIISVNRAFLQMLELEGPVDFRTLTPSDYYCHAEDRERLFEQMKRHRQIEKLQCQWETSQGNIIWVAISARTMDDEQGRVQYVDGVVEDITERKKSEEEREQLQAQLNQAQKMEAVGHLAGGIAHDFNNMLSVVMGNIELARMALGPDIDDGVSQQFKSVQDAAQRSSDLVRQLLAFARKQAINPVILDVNGTIAGMLKVLHRLIGENIELVWIPGHKVGRVRMDPSQIDQILANLMVNARDAIDGVGRVTIETDTVLLAEEDCLDVDGCQPGHFVLMAVSDTGCGMSGETMTQAFDPFFTTKTVGRGTGLGLATVYGVVKQNKGLLRLDSELGVGTTFKIYLPVAQEQTMAAAFDEKAAPPPLGQETILVVEDDSAILMIAESLLKNLGYQVLVADGADAALEIVNGHNGAIDLLLTDVIMPKMNGRQLAEKIVDIYPGIKCLYMSGYTDEVIVHQGMVDMGISFISKPFSIGELGHKVREVLDARQ